jgi:hypothetical protein
VRIRTHLSDLCVKHIVVFLKLPNQTTNVTPSLSRLLSFFAASRASAASLISLTSSRRSLGFGK